MSIKEEQDDSWPSHRGTIIAIRSKSTSDCIELSANANNYADGKVYLEVSDRHGSTGVLLTREDAEHLLWAIVRQFDLAEGVERDL